jgi:hypothetical protein
MGLGDFRDIVYDEEGREVIPARFATSARPGTDSKIEILAHRHSVGEFLYHPDDEPLLAREKY